MASIYYNLDGYPCFGGGIPVHLYVATGWVDGYFDGAEVNHKDYDRTNFCADNLEWVTHLDNIHHSSSVGRYSGRTGEKNPNYNNHKLHFYYLQNPSIAKEKLGRKGKQNGRARDISVYIPHTNETMFFETIGDCAKWLLDNKYASATINSIRQSIITSITNNSTYKGLKFQYI